MAETNWPAALKPLLAKYKDKKHPLEYHSLYQLLVMVVLSAQDSDKHINQVAPPFFGAYPDMKRLARAEAEDLYRYIGKVRNFGNKAKWLIGIARAIGDDKKIPLSMEALTALPGIGRKSANVIMREAGVKAEGVIVDLHVVRVAPRLGITRHTDPKKIEQDLMQAIPQKDWGQLGMAISFLGREICRPTAPRHAECPVSSACTYYRELSRTTTKKAVKKP